jgi:hypothetical protein
MVLTLRALSSFSDINNYSFADSILFTPGDATTIYFQLVDPTRNVAYYGFNPVGLPYHPSPSAVLSVTINSINTAKVVTRFATIASVDDTSIWSMPLLATDPLGGSLTVNFTLTDGATVINGIAPVLIRGVSTNPGC